MEFLLPILFVLSLSIFPATPQFIPLLGDPCANDDVCGKGKCELNSSALLGFDCACDSGWTKMEFFGRISTPCVFPNCSSFNPPLPPIPEFNITSPCNLIWCGDGKCVVNGTTYYCQCNPGSDNVFNATALPCFKKEWSLELDCGGVRLGQDSPPPPASGSSINVPKFSWSNGALTTILLITIFLLFW
nr:neurogenic locus notch homolog protein 3-like [Ipomoea batatas]